MAAARASARREGATRLEVDERDPRIGLDALEPGPAHQVGGAAGGEALRIEGAGGAAEGDLAHQGDRLVADAEGRARPA